MSILIRAAHIKDIPSLAELERECFSLPWSENSFKESMDGANTVFYVCETEDDIVGYVGAVFAFDECSVTNVCTSQNARRQGIGEALMRYLEAECKGRGAARIFLEVRESNAGAISLYEKLGYSRLGIRRGFYSKPREDAFVYGKEI